MLNFIIALKKTANFLLPATISYGVAIAASYGLFQIFDYNEVVLYCLLALSAVILTLGIIFIIFKDKIDWVIYPQRVFISASSVAMAAFLMWKDEYYKLAFSWWMYGLLFGLLVFSLVYRRFFKRIAVNTTLKEHIDNDFTVIPDDKEKTARLVAEQLQQQLKRRYLNRLMVRPIAQSFKKGDDNIVVFTSGFITKGRAPEIIFELDVELPMIDFASE